MDLNMLSSTVRRTCGLILALGLVACGGGYDIENDAYSDCVAHVRGELVSPSTASFSPIEETEVTDLEREGRYRVTGWVDAQNASGGMMRAEWRCEVRPRYQQTWLDYIETRSDGSIQ